MPEDQDLILEMSRLGTIRERLHEIATEIGRVQSMTILRRSVATSDRQAGRISQQEWLDVLDSCMELDIYVERARKAITTADINVARHDPGGEPPLKRRRRRTLRRTNDPVPDALKKRRRWRGYA